MAISDATRRWYDPALSDVLGDAGDPIAIAFDGKTYKLGFPIQRAKDRYEKLLLAAEKASVLVQKEEGLLTATEYSARVDALADQIRNRAFSTGKPLWLKRSGTPEGWLLWVQSLFMEHHIDLTTDVVEKLVASKTDDVRLALEVVVPPFLSWIASLTRTLGVQIGNREMVEKAEKAVAAIAAAQARPTPSE